MSAGLDPRRRPAHAAMAAFAAGLALCEARTEVVALCAASIVAVTAGLRAQAVGVVIAGCLVAGGMVGSLRLEALDQPGQRLDAARPSAYTLLLLERPRRSAFGARAAVRVAAGPGAGARLQATGSRYLRWPPGLRPGTELAARARFSSVADVGRRPRGRSGFDAAAFLRSRAMVGELELDSLRPTGRRRGGTAGLVDRMRVRAEHAIERGLPAPGAALLRGMVLGEDESIDPDVRDSFRASGLAHILAVSGQNVALLCALALPLLALLGVGPLVRMAVLLGLIALYVPLAGAGPSLQRAGIMGAAALVAMAASRPASRSYALLLAAAGTLALNPRAWGDPGWQLSFAAVAGIVVLAPALRTRLGRLPRVLAEGLVVTVAATVSTAPLMAHHFGSFSLASLPANVLALPAVPLLMWAGMIEAALAQLGALGAPVDAGVDGVTGALGAAIRPVLDYLTTLAERFGELPGAQLPLPLGSWAAVAGAYALVAAAVLGLGAASRRLRRHGPRVEARWGSLSRGSRRALVGLTAAGLVLLVSTTLGGAKPPDVPTVSFLDVGQGDATLIQAPDGSAALFDGGPPEGGVLRQLRDAGVKRLSLVVATHQSRDHHGGLAGVLAEFPVDFFLDGGDGTRDPTFRALERTAARKRIRTIPSRAGVALQAGSISVHVLSPPPRPPGPPPEDPNPRATVAIVDVGGMRVFLSADAESEALLPLSLPHVDAMKVPHHGSADPGLPQVLQRLRPRVASIPVGQNTYGHPTPSTLHALRAAHVPTYRNDRNGTLRVSVEGGRLAVRPQR